MKNIALSQKAILFSSYFPPIQYMSKLLLHEEFYVEQWEHFPKQTYRNRCHILSANGMLPLIIPILHGDKEHQPMLEVKIANDHPWQQLHWKSITTAYRNSPFFDFYEDDLVPLFEKRYDHLLEFNTELFHVLTRLLGISANLQYTEKYEKEFHDEVTDYRLFIHPKSRKTSSDNIFRPLPYIQTFAERHGFVPNLSVMDALFNLGKESGAYLQQVSAF